jgi:cytochrome c biogenesis protein CcmG, thiol:disulfide interchange protein DsbE
MFRRILSIALMLALLPLAASAQQKDEFERERKEGDTTKNALEGKAPPELMVKDWVNTDGKPLKLADLKGKVVVLDFWGTWCGPCVAAMPHLKELYAKHKSAGLEVIGVHTTNGGEEMAKFVQEKSLPWPVAVDADQGTVKAFKVDSYPDYYIIDKAGNLRVADLANKELDRVIEVLLKD